jgi:hypothetical protein
VQTLEAKGGVAALTASDRLTTTETMLVAALAAGATQADAGAAAGVSERTVRRRLEDEGFADQVLEARSLLVTRTSARLTGLTGDAVDALMSLLADTVPASVRLRAAFGVLDAARVWRDCGEVERRIVAIEAELASERDGAR